MHLFFLTPQHIDLAITRILNRWQPELDERLKYRGWAMMMIDVCEALADGDAVACQRDLEWSRDELHGQIADRLHAHGVVDLELVSRMSWLSFLVEQLGEGQADEPLLAAA